MCHMVPEERQANESLWACPHTHLNSSIYKYKLCIELLAGLEV